MSHSVDPHFTTDATSSYQEGDSYIICTGETAGSQDFDIAYSSLVPEGETRPIHISHCHASQSYWADHFSTWLVLIESPAGSNKWKMTLAEVKDYAGEARASNDFSQPIMLSNGDSLCIKANMSVSTDIPEQLVVGLHYRVGP